MEVICIHFEWIFTTIVLDVMNLVLRKTWFEGTSGKKGREKCPNDINGRTPKFPHAQSKRILNERLLFGLREEKRRVRGAEKCLAQGEFTLPFEARNEIEENGSAFKFYEWQ